MADKTIEIEFASRDLISTYKGKDVNELRTSVGHTFPLKPTDKVTIRVSEGVETDDLLEWLAFCDEPGSLAPRPFAANALEYFSDYELHLVQGQIGRLAILNQEHSTWQLVGLKLGSDTKILLQDLDEYYYPANRYLASRVVIESFSHVEGSAPVSWDYSSALLQIRNYLVKAYGGDNPPCDVIDHIKEFESQVYEWLLDQRLCLMFILDQVPPKWASGPQVDRYFEALATINELAGVSANLTEIEQVNVLSLIQDNLPGLRRLVDVLSAPSSPQSEQLIISLESLANSGEIFSLFSQTDNALFS